MTELVELDLPPRPDVLALARLVVAAVVATDPLFDDERIDDLRLAVSEACTNAIESQRARGGDAFETPIEIRCAIETGRIEVAVRDHGGGFDPTGLPEHPPVTDPTRLEFERGLGIPLIRLLSDKVDFRQEGDGTVVVMTFDHRPLPDPRPLR